MMLYETLLDKVTNTNFITKAAKKKVDSLLKNMSKKAILSRASYLRNEETQRQIIEILDKQNKGVK